MKTSDMPKVQVFLPPADHAALEALAKGEDRSLGYVARKMIQEGLRKLRREPEQSSAA